MKRAIGQVSPGQFASFPLWAMAYGSFRIIQILSHLKHRVVTSFILRGGFKPNSTYKIGDTFTYRYILVLLLTRAFGSRPGNVFAPC
ncbi:hypothetical protein CR513_20639, partial [Mucuna pruriens]